MIESLSWGKVILVRRWPRMRLLKRCVVRTGIARESETNRKKVTTCAELKV